MKSTTPKPLIRLFGIPLIEHKIRKLKGCDIAVVYHDKKLAEYLQKKFPKVELIFNPYPEKENGYSLYCAKGFIKEGETFVLLMADHYYGDAFYQEIGKTKKGNYLFVSPYCYDPLEATKVQTQNHHIIKIGKELREYDYFDTGFFILSWEIFKYIEKILDIPKITLSRVMQLVADDKKLYYKEIKDIWIDIDTKEDLKLAENLIRKSLIKESDGFISKLINRKISTRITPLLARFDAVTPNKITVFTTLLGIIAGTLFLSKNVLLAGILTQISSILDGCDGELARIKNLSSKFGAVLDTVLDRYVDTFIIFSIYLSLDRTTIVSGLFFLCITGTILVSYISHLTKIRPYFITRDIRLFLIMLFSIISPIYTASLEVLLAVIGTLSHLGVVYSLLKYKKQT
ncbi:MAG: NTP transferase domain-containing protein [Aquificae bacterium]|nr:NTP transferase domain-containing protein [Aquificota bacterium]